MGTEPSSVGLGRSQWGSLALIQRLAGDNIHVVYLDRGQRTTCGRSQFSPSTMGVLGIKLRLLVLAASVEG